MYVVPPKLLCHFMALGTGRRELVQLLKTRGLEKHPKGQSPQAASGLGCHLLHVCLPHTQAAAPAPSVVVLGVLWEVTRVRWGTGCSPSPRWVALGVLWEVTRVRWGTREAPCDGVGTLDGTQRAWSSIHAPCEHMARRFLSASQELLPRRHSCTSLPDHPPQSCEKSPYATEDPSL